jgi:ribonuclease E
MKRMLFNATHAEELRVAIVDGQKLIDLDIETAGKEQRKSNIYKGVITRIEPSLEAAFVDYGSERHGFLPFKEVSRAYFQNPDADPARVSIREALREGQELIVQVDKDERGSKGAALTTFISLAGRYIVLMPNNPRGGGVSRRVEGEERNELRDTISQLEVPAGMSIIARTAGIGRSLEELTWDMGYLMQLWQAIETAAKQQSGAFLIYQEGSLVIRAIRDYFHQEIGEILIDTESIYDQAQQFMGHVMPQNVGRVKLYKDDVPLFSRFQIEHQIETAYSRQVPLPSGGAIVIDHTEALVTVDVNSARATKGADIEETALRTNLEAADEIARQLRLRDLGGLVVIDFIDMESTRNQRDVENRLRDALKYDRARVQTGKISRFGLMELSRQRLQTSLGETSHISCPRCNGTGHIRSIESSALHILRILQEEAMKDNTAAVHAQVPIDVATYLLNEKRNEFHAIETRLKVSVLLIPNVNLETPHYTISRLRHDELNQNEPVAPSYKMASVPVDATEPASAAQKAEIIRPQAAVQGITPAQPAPGPSPVPVSEKAAGPSIFEKIFGWLSRKSEPAPAVPATRVREPQRRHGHERKEHRGRPEERKGGPRREPKPDNEARREQPRNRPPAAASERRPERPQPQQNARPPRPDLAAVEQRLPSDRPELTKEGDGRGRRRRGRRDRHGERSEPRQEQRASMANAPVAEEFRSAPVSEYVPDEVISQRSVEVEAMPMIAETRPIERPSEPAPAPVPEVAEVNARPTLPVEKAPEEEPKIQPKPAPTPQPAWKMEPVSLPPDLVMIETQSEKIQPIYTEAPVVRPARPPRRRVEQVQEEMLKQVETVTRPADQVGETRD